MMENKDFMDKLNEVKYDVGVAEWIADNTFAYLMFHALNIPNVIQTRGIYEINSLIIMRDILLQFSRRTHWNWRHWD
jgi:hypothetical protein